MKYSIVKMDDYDKAFKFDDKQVLCYSKDYFDDLPDDEKEVVGEIRKYKPDEDAENTIVVVKKQYEVFDVGSTNNLFYSLKGYLKVDDKKFIALYKNRLPFFLWLLFIILIAVLVLLLIIKPEEELETFNPLPPVDSSVEYVEEPVTQDDVGGGEVTMDYSTTAVLDLGTKVIDIEFKNPGVSTHEILLELYVVDTQNDSEQEYLIATSGRIPIGGKLTKMKFSEDPAMFESTGKYMARYHVKYYDPITGEKSLLDSELKNITLTVIE